MVATLRKGPSAQPLRAVAVMYVTMRTIDLDELERAAASRYGHAMNRFDGGEFACPWLRWQRHDIENWREREGVLIMQDWGNVGETLDEAIAHLKCPCPGSGAREFTTCNLFENDAWRQAIWGPKPTWLVMNAVWGLRKPKPNGDKASKTGYLGDALHKLAFPIWRKVLAQLSADRNRELHVVFAGSWARFDNPELNCSCLVGFLTNWSEWAVGAVGVTPQAENRLDEGLVEIGGSAYYCPHPSVWRKVRDLSAGPPLAA